MACKGDRRRGEKEGEEGVNHLLLLLLLLLTRREEEEAEGRTAAEE